MTGDAMRDLREALRRAAINHCCPSKRDCDNDCQGCMVDQQMAAITAAPAEARLALARAITPDTHAEAMQREAYDAGFQCAVELGHTLATAWAEMPDASPSCGLTEIAEKYIAWAEKWAPALTAARGADAEGGK